MAAVLLNFFQCSPWTW